MAKYKSKLREKLRAAAKRNETDGRSRTLSYGDRSKYKDVTIPKEQRKEYFDQLKDTVIQKVKKSVKNKAEKHAKEVLGGKLAEGSKAAESDLAGIRHPAQLIPAIKAGGTLTNIIKAFINR